VEGWAARPVRRDKSTDTGPDRAQGGASLVEWGAALLLVGAIVAGLIVAIPNEVTPSLRGAICEVFIGQGCQDGGGGQNAGDGGNGGGGNGDGNGGNGNGGNGNGGNGNGGDENGGAQPEPEDDCDFLCSAGGFVGDVGRGLFDGGREFVEGTIGTVTDGACVIAQLGCTEQERQEKIDAISNTWDQFREDPVGFVVDAAKAAVENCRQALGGDGYSIGRCAFDVAGVIVTKKLPKLPGRRGGNGRDGNDSNGPNNRPNNSNDRDRDGRPDCVLVSALGPARGGSGGTSQPIAYANSSNEYSYASAFAYGRLSAPAVTSRVAAAPCPIAEAADRADGAAGRGQEAANRGDSAGARQAEAEARQAAQEAREAAANAGEQRPGSNPEVKRAEAALERARNARRVAAQRNIDQARQSPNRGTREEGKVGNMIRNIVEDFDRPVGPNGSIGQVDIETRRAIIEVASGQRGKTGQATTNLVDRRVNPEGKPVIVWGPGMRPGARDDLRRNGVQVVENEAELKAALRALGENI
jgi:hypothetical protein